MLAVTLLQSLNILLEACALLREVSSEGVDEVVEALGESERAVTEGDDIKAIYVEAVPGQGVETKDMERHLQRLTQTEAPDVMEAGVEMETVAHEALHATARLPLALEDQHTEATSCQEIGTLKAA